MNIRTSTNSHISAVRYSDDTDIHIRVYYQGKRYLPPKCCLLKSLEEAKSCAIRELCNDGYWYQGTLPLQGALDGTCIAAAACKLSNQIEIRVYYQAEDLSLREHCYRNKGWHPGRFIDAARSRSSERNRNSLKVDGTPVRFQEEAPSVLRTLCPTAIL